MRFICLGYADPSIFSKMSKEEMESAMDECFAYDDVLRRGGHFAAGEALQEAKTAVTLRYGAKITEDNSVAGHPKCLIRWESAKNADGSWSAYTAIPAGPVSPTDGHMFTNPNVNFGGEHFGVGEKGAHLLEALDGPLEPAVVDGVVRNAGGTILGADNKAAVVAMLEAIRRIRESGTVSTGP